MNIIYELGELIDGLGPDALRMIFELRVFDDEDGGYNKVSTLARWADMPEDRAKAALDTLVAKDLADFADDLKTPDGDEFGEGFALFEDGSRLRDIFFELEVHNRASEAHQRELVGAK